MRLFTPGSTVSISATTTTGRATLPPGSLTARIVNPGDDIAFVKFGDSTVVATASDTPVLPGDTVGFSIPGNATSIAAIMAANTATIYITGGDGS